MALVIVDEAPQGHTNGENGAFETVPAANIRPILEANVMVAVPARGSNRRPAIVEKKIQDVQEGERILGYCAGDTDPHRARTKQWTVERIAALTRKTGLRPPAIGPGSTDDEIQAQRMAQLTEISRMGPEGALKRIQDLEREVAVLKGRLGNITMAAGKAVIAGRIIARELELSLVLPDGEGGSDA